MKTSNKSGYAGVYNQLLAGLGKETKSAMTWSENHNVIWINGRPYMYNPRKGTTDYFVCQKRTEFQNDQSSGPHLKK